MDALRIIERDMTKRCPQDATAQTHIVEEYAPADSRQVISLPQEHIDGDVTIGIARSFEEMEAIRPLWQQMQRREPSPTPNADYDRYISVIKADAGRTQPLVMLFKRSNRPVAMIIGRSEEHQLNLRLGYQPLLRSKLRCLNIAYGGILGRPEGDLCSLLVGRLTEHLRSRQADMIYFNHLRTDTDFYRAIRSAPGLLTRDCFPTMDEHWRMAVPQSMEHFYSARSRGHRHNLRKAIRRFDEDFSGGGNMQLVRDYTSPEDAAEFLRLAADISVKTYQNALGAGLTNDRKTRDQITAAAQHGWFCGHVLFAGDTACAFQLALHYGNVYYMENIGYDPAFSSYKPGLILFLRVLEGLCADSSVDTVDFYFGDAEYKNRFDTEHWPEACVCMFAPRLYPMFINALRCATTGLNTGLRYIVNKTGSVARIKRKWRNHFTTAAAENAVPGTPSAEWELKSGISVDSAPSAVKHLPADAESI